MKAFQFSTGAAESFHFNCIMQPVAESHINSLNQDKIETLQFKETGFLVDCVKF